LEEAMNRKSIRSGTAAALAGGVIAAAAAATLALASIPDADGVIHGCYKNKTGSLRVVDSGAGCSSGETALDWNHATQPGGVSGYQIISGEPLTLDPGGSGQAEVSCPDGTRAIGGGYIARPLHPRQLLGTRGRRDHLVRRRHEHVGRVR
jgi:hypothetical protein